MKDKNQVMELNCLWQPVRRYLAQYVSDLYGRKDGHVLEAGPFSGLTFELALREASMSFHLAVFPKEVAEGLREEARQLGLITRVTITESDDTLSGVPMETFDLILFRGAFFFPSFFRLDLAAIYARLKGGGMALLGGGFGRHTPADVIRPIEKRSRDLNQALGRVRVTEKDLTTMLDAAGLRENATIITEGGLWAVLRK
jgi:hypothetical protein